MYRSAVVFGLYLSFAIAVGAACSNGSGPELPDPGSLTPSNGGTGNTSTSGGTAGASTGGSFGTGGSTGGSFGTGGSTGGTGGTTTTGGTGGTTPTAGKSGTGGSTGATGGTTGGAGRASGTGGSTGGTGTGGTSATGGTTATGGTGGTTATGGTTGMAGGGSGVSCDATWSVTNDGFVRMPAKGGACWSGYAFAGGDKSSTVVFPGMGTDFSKSMGKLEISGTVGSATADNMYAGNVYFGFNVGQTAGSSTSGMATPTGTSLTITCTGCASPKMRAQLVAGSTSWCTDLTSGTAIPYTSFKQECYNATPGAAYAKEPIASIQISIPGGAMSATFDVTLSGVTEQ